MLFKNTERAYLDTKKELLEQFNLYAIVSLPAGVFANAVANGTGPKTNLLFFDHKGPTRQIWYYDVHAVGFSLTRSQRPIADNDLPDCLTLWYFNALFIFIFNIFIVANKCYYSTALFGKFY